ncbi:T9SS type A sorting domain-containing protein [Flavobacterium sp. SM2513]|uniref:T9SS type A sorting domain-containing protein n=1 Tax=Flavobacterium sp. SM2513 TaxID=3424766 RepID=UPI003D7FFEB6
MKKILLSVALLATSLGFSQALQSENFNGLTVGNLSTDITGATAGQGSWFTLYSNGTAPTTSTNAAVTNSQVVATGHNSTNGLALVGPNGNAGSRFLWKDGLPTAWAARTTGNNVIEVEVNVNPGARGVSRNRFGVTIYNADYLRSLVGFSVNSFTGELFLVAYATPTGQAVGNYNYSLAAAPGVQLPENAWSRVGISYNFTTGQVSINSTAITGGALTVAGSSANTAPAEINFAVFSGSTTALPNISAGTMVFDNFTSRAIDVSNLLGTSDFVATKATVSVYPNPATDVLNVNTSNSSITAVQIVDLNGRQVMTKSFNNVSDAQLNVNELSAGMYLINITSGDTVQTKKFLKQ